MASRIIHLCISKKVCSKMILDESRCTGGKVMLNYTDEQIKIEIENIMETGDFKIKPVGNHDLKRHLVYQIDMKDGEKYIFKLYYRDRRRSREIASLKFLEDSKVKCP